MQSNPRRVFWIVASFLTMRGAVQNLGDCFPFFYDKVPSYSLISLIGLSSYFYGFKFMMAPIQHCYTSHSYGRKKTWLVGSSLTVGLLLLVLSNFTKIEDQIAYAYVYILMSFFLMNADISCISLALHEISDPNQVGLLCSIFDTIGRSLTSLVYIWLISYKLQHYFSLTQPIIYGKTIITLVGAMMIAMSVGIHALYHQRQVEDFDEQEGIWSVLSRYNVFFNTESKYFRISVMFLICYIGNNFFKSAYLTQAVRGGFSKEIGISIANFWYLIGMVVVYYLQPHLKDRNKYDYLIGCMLIEVIVGLIIVIFELNGTVGACIYYFFNCFTQSVMYITTIIINASLPQNPYMAMYYSAIASMWNIGGTSSVQLWIIGKIGFTQGSLLGFGYSFGFVLVFVAWMKEWVQEGKDFHQVQGDKEGEEQGEGERRKGEIHMEGDHGNTREKGTIILEVEHH